MKHVQYRDTLILLEQAMALLKPLLMQADADNYVVSMLNYLIDQGEVKSLSAFFELMRKELPNNLENTIMTIAEQLRQQGIQQGVQRGEATILLEQLEYRFGPMSSHDQERVHKADPSTLLQWGRKIFEAKTLKDVLN